MNTVPLTEENIDLVSGFCCGKEGLDNYLKEQALKDQEDHKATTTLIIKTYKGITSLIGFYTLKNTCILFRSANTVRGYPAIEIVFLAIDKKYQRKGLGSKVLKKIIYKSIEISRSFSAITVLILSSEQDAVGFYKKNRFIDFPYVFEILYDDCRTSTIPLLLNLIYEE